MIPETFSYTLTLNGRYAGTQDWVVRTDKGTLVARVQTDFGGALPAGRWVQESRIEPQTGFSLAYAEAEGGGKKPSFETVFDDHSGMVTLRQGKDEASAPLLEGHHDPLSLLLWLRRAGQAETPAHEATGQQATGQQSTAQQATGPRLVTVRMVGGRVHVQVLPGSEVSGAAAQVYFLRPGGAYVYVEQEAPHRLLRLIQPSDFGPVEALLSLKSAAPGQERSSQTVTRAGAQGHPVRAQVGKPRRRSK